MVREECDICSPHTVLFLPEQHLVPAVGELVMLKLHRSFIYFTPDCMHGSSLPYAGNKASSVTGWWHYYWKLNILSGS